MTHPIWAVHSILKFLTGLHRSYIKKKPELSMVDAAFIYGLIVGFIIILGFFLFFLLLYFRKATRENQKRYNPAGNNGDDFNLNSNLIPELYKNKGEEADRLYEEGLYDEARKNYQEIINLVIESRAVDVFVISKCVLGLMISMLKEDSLEEAFKIWGSKPDSTLGIGIYGLENGQVNGYDAALYAMVSGVFYAIAAGDPRRNSEQVDACMKAACSFYQKNEHQKELELAVNNWKRCLLLVYEDGVVHLAHMEAIKKFTGKLETQFEAVDIYFPRPAKWVIDWKVKGTTVYTPDESE